MKKMLKFIVKHSNYWMSSPRTTHPINLIVKPSGFDIWRGGDNITTSTGLRDCVIYQRSITFCGVT